MSIAFASASTQYLQLASAPLSGVPLTISAWVYVTTVAANGSPIFIGDKDTPTDRVFITMLSTSAVRGVIGDGVNTHSADATGTYSANTWVHVAVSVNSSGHITTYRDGGNSATTSTYTLTSFAWDRTSIGYLGDSTPANYFDGRICEVAVYNTNLGANSIYALSRRASPLLVRPNNLVMYAPLRRNYLELKAGASFTGFNSPTVAAHARIYNPTAPEFYPSFTGAAPAPAPAGDDTHILVNGGLISSGLINGGLVQ